MRILYTIALYLLVPAVLVRLAWAGLRHRGYWQRWGERFAFVPARRGEEPLVWIHAVSAGEAQAARPLVEHLQARVPRLRILVTTTTPTGAQIVANHLGASVEHRYFPYDLPGTVRRFLRRIRPSLLVIMETELWPNLLCACRRAGVRVLLANARLSQRSLAGYSLVPGLAGEVLDAISAFAAQSRADAERFLALGADPARVTITGSLKFDVRMLPSVVEHAEAVRRALGQDRPVWIAASTHPGEEESVLEAFAAVRDIHPSALLLLVPRHPERAEAVAELCTQRGFTCLRRSAGPCTPAVEVYLVDTMGELALFYAAADVAYVGGSLVPMGGHNVLEPAALGVPIISGPHTSNFEEIRRLLEDAGALQTVTGAPALAEALVGLLAGPERRAQAGEAGRAVVEANRGAVEEVAALAGRLLAGGPVSVPGRTPP